MPHPVFRHITIKKEQTYLNGSDEWRFVGFDYRHLNLNDFVGMTRLAAGCVAAAQIEAPNSDIRVTILCPCCTDGTAKRVSRPDHLQFAETSEPCDICDKLGYLLQSVTRIPDSDADSGLPDTPIILGTESDLHADRL